jgi:hypothetical protein
MSSVAILSVISNGAFLFPLVTSLRVREYLYAPLYALVIVFSTWYHTCDWKDSACTFRFQVHRDLDFLLAFLLIPTVVVFLIKFQRRYKWIEVSIVLVYAGALAAVIFTNIGNGTSGVIIALVVAGSALLFVSGYWVWYWVKNEKTHGPAYNYFYGTTGILMLAQAAALFLMQDYFVAQRLYHYYHATWHAAAAIGFRQFMLVHVVYETEERKEKRPQSTETKETQRPLLLYPYGKFTTHADST